MTSAGLIFAFLWLFMFTICSLHPVREADTKCEFAFLPTGYLPVNKTVSVPGECMSITCHSDLTISGLSCPTHFVFPGCHLTEADHYKQYPECCPQLICYYIPFTYVSEYNKKYN